MSKIQAELATATGIKPESGQPINDVAYVKDLMRGVAKLPDEAWDKLSTDAQTWYNSSADSVKAGTGVTIFPDMATAEEPARRSRRVDPESAPPPPATSSSKPAKGDKVNVVTVKGNSYAGKVVEPDDDGYLILDDGKEELSLKWANIKSCAGDAPVPAPAPAAEEGRRRNRKTEDDAPAPSKLKEPQVGDTVEIKTKRGTIKVGNVVEMKPGAFIAIKDVGGDELEYEYERIESVTIKVDNSKKSTDADEGRPRRRAGGDDEPAPRSRSKGAEPDAAPSGGERDVGIGEKARLLVIQNRSMSRDDFVRAALKNWPTAKENTLRLIYGDVHKLLGMLKSEGMLKS